MLIVGNNQKNASNSDIFLNSLSYCSIIIGLTSSIKDSICSSVQVKNFSKNLIGIVTCV